MTITKDTILGDILDAAPQTAPIFLSHLAMHAWAARPRAARRWSRPVMCTGQDVDALLAKLNAAVAGE